jgi:hypothetical protein
MSRAERRARFEAKEAVRLGPEEASAIAGPGVNTVRRPKRFVKSAERRNMSRSDLILLLDEIAAQPEPDVVVEIPSKFRSALGFGVTILAAWSGGLLAIATMLAVQRWIG